MKKTEACNLYCGPVRQWKGTFKETIILW